MAKRGPKGPRSRCDAKTEKVIFQMAFDQCKDTTIAETIGMDVKTFQNNYSKETRQKRAEGKARIYRLQMQAAEDGNPTMLIWLGKQHLEQTDKQDVTSGGAPIKAIVGFDSGAI